MNRNLLSISIGVMLPMLSVVFTARAMNTNETDIPSQLLGQGWVTAASGADPQAPDPVIVEPETATIIECALGEGEQALSAPSTNQGAMAYGVTAILPQDLATSPDDDTLIVETARALDNDWRKIYAYVRNHVRFVPGWGFARGASRALLDREANDADTALLTVGLLRAAGYSATILWRTNALDMAVSGDAQGYDACSWLAVSNATDAIETLWGAGYQAYGYINGSNQARLVVEQFMVAVDVYGPSGGYRYFMNPAFKPQRTIPARDVLAGLDYSRTNLLALAKEGATTDTTNSVLNLNEGNIRSEMIRLSSGLAAARLAQGTNVSDRVFMGGQEIVPQDMTSDSSVKHGTTQPMYDLLALPTK